MLKKSSFRQSIFKIYQIVREIEPQNLFLTTFYPVIFVLKSLVNIQFKTLIKIHQAVFISLSLKPANTFA